MSNLITTSCREALHALCELKVTFFLNRALWKIFQELSRTLNCDRAMQPHCTAFVRSQCPRMTNRMHIYEHLCL
jgi:hypothetical protein